MEITSNYVLVVVKLYTFAFRVVLATDAQFRLKVVIKLFQFSDNRAKNQVIQSQYRNELAALQSAQDSSRIIKLIDSYEETYYIEKNGTKIRVAAIVTEYSEEGSLLNYLETHGNLKETVCRYYFRQIIESTTSFLRLVFSNFAML